MAAELEELTKSQVWVDELAYTAEKGALIQQVREFIMSLTHLHHADFDVRFRQKLTKRWPLRLVMICKRRPAVRCPEIQVHVPHRTPGSGFGARRAWTAHILGTIFYKFGFGHRVCLEHACKTPIGVVCHIFAPRHFADPWFVQVVSLVWVVILRILKLFVCMYRAGGQFSVLFVLRYTTFVFDSCWCSVVDACSSAVRGRR